MPKFKAHPWTTVTFSMKNYIGIQDDRHRLIDHDQKLNEKVADLYRQADLVLNPSTADNMPISLLEGLASGVPIVSTNVGGIPFLVEDRRTAMLVPPREPARMAEAALEVMSHPERAYQLRAAGIECARRFTWDEVRPALFSVYARALGVPSLLGGST